MFTLSIKIYFPTLFQPSVRYSPKVTTKRKDTSSHNGTIFNSCIVILSENYCCILRFKLLGEISGNIRN